MPTPVSTARQYLTDEAARVLDEAVNVARRRTHAQTTSLHAVSALLAPPSSLLREACARARSCAYSQRLQFRALELTVGVSLDRLPTTKSLDDPPISNSLMAAIKRSQANQRRHPDTFHLYQQLQSQCPSSSPQISILRVELKQFVLSILDDPIVSRVLGEAGFGSLDIKLVILNPPTISRFPRDWHPPQFFCKSPDYELNRRPFNFPFSTSPQNENVDGNSRRIGEVLARKNSRNPLLIGSFANEALGNFTECLKKGEDGVLPREIRGLSIICIAEEISEFFRHGESKKPSIALKIKELSGVVEGCKGPGVVVSYGDLKVFVDSEGTEEAKYLVSELNRLVEIHCGKLWLVGAAGKDEIFMKFLENFPSVQKDWDLHLLPITTSSAGFNARSSLMGSFVPFAGFFPTPSEYENLQSNINQSVARCNLCNEKYEGEVSMLLKGSTSNSVADQHSGNVPPWLQTTACGPSSRRIGVEANNDIVFNIKVVGLQKKWNDICQRLHQSHPAQPNVLPSTRGESKSQDLILSDESRISDQSISPSKPMIRNVSTDLGLGTIYVTMEKEKPEPSFEDPKDLPQHISCPVSSDKTSFIPQVVGDGLALKDFKYLQESLAEIVYWQDEAIHAISQTVSKHRNGHNPMKGNIWLSFLGPDKVGKRKIARLLAEKVFGSKDSLLFVDLSSIDEGNNSSNSMFDHCGLRSHGMNLRGKTVVDYIADELSKKHYSVVLLENIEKSDFLVQSSLSRSLKTGRFPNLHGREIRINNTIFVIASSGLKAQSNCLTGTYPPMFPEESILAAKDSQMKFFVGPQSPCGMRIEDTNVFITTSRNKTLNSSSANKRKLNGSNTDVFRSSKRAAKVFLDLNLPVEEEETEGEQDIDDSTTAWLDDFLKQTDENVIFKPFEFDALAREILKGINSKLVEIFGSKAILEVDVDILTQMLAAAWVSDRREAAEDWVEKVIGNGFLEAQKKIHHFRDDNKAIKLVASAGIPVEVHACGIRLPARVCLT
ncbi:hypothetical protein DM860_012464 [Cuscuta australis]|uniref:Clp R domain-containing protein n=1 Tax=Cuscuta australis TaxID=267555 RepID=A0A328DH63_9ASTE|nr:hypothetical protein DM860_012464 [Cuscuta australis]